MSIRTRSTNDAIVNGVDVDRLKSTMAAMKAVPELARFTFRISNRWIKGGLNRTCLGGFHGAGAENHRDGFVVDDAQPALLAGSDEAPNPLEYLLHALVGCLTTTLVYHAAIQGVRIHSIESQVEGQVDLRSFLGVRDDQPVGIEGVNVRLRVKAECSEDELARLMDVARRRSPVADIVTRAVPTFVVCEAM